MEKPIIVIELPSSWFRIEIGDKKGKTVDFTRIASLEINGHTYIAASEYYRGYLPVNKVLEIKELDTNIIQKMQETMTEDHHSYRKA